MSPKEREEMILDYTPVVRDVVDSVARKLPSWADIDGMFGEAIVRMVKCIDRIDGTKTPEQVKSLIIMNVKGECIDYIRKLDPVTRRARINMKIRDRKIVELTKELGRAPFEYEVMKSMGMREKYYRSFLRSISHHTVSMDAPLVVKDKPTTFQEIIIDERHDHPSENMQKIDDYAALYEAVDQLPEREKKCIMLRLKHPDYSRWEIAEILGVSESRICQINADAERRMKRMLKLRLAS